MWKKRNLIPFSDKDFFSLLSFFSFLFFFHPFLVFRVVERNRHKRSKPKKKQRAFPPLFSKHKHKYKHETRNTKHKDTNRRLLRNRKWTCPHGRHKRGCQMLLLFFFCHKKRPLSPFRRRTSSPTYPPRPLSELRNIA